MAEAALGTGNLKEAVKLPEGESEDQWLIAYSKLVIYQQRQLYNHQKLKISSLMSTCYTAWLPSIVPHKNVKSCLQGQSKHVL